MQKFPDHLGEQHGLSPEQVSFIRRINEQNLDPMAKGAAMSVMAESFKYLNQSAPSPEQTRATATQAIAERAAQEVRESGVTATAGLSGGTPAIAGPPPTSLRPGSPESHSLLASALNLAKR